ncbi:hypothetical protein G6F46_006548 [Rhizopus delemar]|uniref:Uncharacterized protein n=3 Tax=Rhizopus TaxID=4842 RepID=I1BZ43_RHIO9|nr:hypothetical protein RO3G_06178 [Rhizopus delemar RA 99-880]KAG1051070.1 hypothetical protein G6F43_006703 [Rhizopus delemar]KAG1543962.1 hypothetical protein G6F51_006353 [Rhizopus arrhizus]KAG1458850.1 hypothetical protein G6F55_005110 [Rhizopus delemar]KAG1497217.1 hypothetical protein G6F54_005914 [Rhizopus delemar]|eukprot:EIE81473.1 hypothetical protein RO3G_06178 [Rhizopus delemar RA 99-880]
MSTKAKLTLASSVAFCIASVTGVHYIQNSEKENLRAGVLQDEERRRKKQEQQALNMKELQEQTELHEALLKTQSVTMLPSNDSVSKEE